MCDDMAMCDEMTAVMCGGCRGDVLDDDQTAYGCDANLCTNWYHRICLSSDEQTMADLSVVAGL